MDTREECSQSESSILCACGTTWLTALRLHYPEINAAMLLSEWSLMFFIKADFLRLELPVDHRGDGEDLTATSESSEQRFVLTRPDRSVSLRWLKEHTVWAAYSPLQSVWHNALILKCLKSKLLAGASSVLPKHFMVFSLCCWSFDEEPVSLKGSVFGFSQTLMGEWMEFAKQQPEQSLLCLLAFIYPHPVFSRSSEG